jgi:hypothetical protein
LDEKSFLKRATGSRAFSLNERQAIIISLPRR